MDLRAAVGAALVERFGDSLPVGEVVELVFGALLSARVEDVLDNDAEVEARVEAHDREIAGRVDLP